MQLFGGYGIPLEAYKPGTSGFGLTEDNLVDSSGPKRKNRTYSGKNIGVRRINLKTGKIKRIRLDEFEWKI